MSKISLVFGCLACAGSGWRVQVPGNLHARGNLPAPRMQDWLLDLDKQAAATNAPSAAPSVAPSMAAATFTESLSVADFFGNSPASPAPASPTLADFFGNAPASPAPASPTPASPAPATPAAMSPTAGAPIMDLSSLHSFMQEHEPAKSLETDSPPLHFTCESFDYFAPELLSPKGVRKLADVGSPADATRPLYKNGSTSVGSWSCTEGGFPGSGPARDTTEIFYIFEGEGTLTDSDGVAHPMKAGDTVVLPKGWIGRWDITKFIHKVWAVVDHEDDVPDTSQIIRAVVSSDIAKPPLEPLGVRKDADYGQPSGSSRKLYKAGPVSVGAWGCSEGGFPVVNRPTTEFFHILEGVCFLTNTDGTARRITAGDTVVLPKGWSGRWDIIKPIRKIWVVVAE